jgi:glycosyltransferase involved in cell wall biosynthesis
MDNAGDRMARICVDGFNLAMPNGSGIATYARNLLIGLRGLGHETQILLSSTDDEHSTELMKQVALFDAAAHEHSSRVRRILKRLARPPTLQAWPVAQTGDVILREFAERIPPVDRIWASRDVFHAANHAYAAFGWNTPLKLGRDVQTDIVHWTCPLPMHEPRVPNFYTFHDLIPLVLPFTTLDNKRNFYSMCHDLVSRGAQIVTVSDRSRQDIIHLLGAREDQVAVTYQAVSMPEYLLTKTDEEVAESISSVFNLGWREYFLYFGAVEPKKNLPRIIEAYLLSGVKAPLVIIGGKAWLNEQKKDLLYDDIIQSSVLSDGVLKRSDRVRRYEYLPSRLLVSLIRGARATLFPSLYEGFGLPVLESMLLGTPVLTSTEGSLPEIAGDAALLVDPYNVDAIRQGILTLDADQDLRSEFSARGRRQAEKFSPERYRARLEEAYKAFV